MTVAGALAQACPLPRPVWVKGKDRTAPIAFSTGTAPATPAIAVPARFGEKIRAHQQNGSHDVSTWLITGCSTGLGFALAQAVIAAGHNAVVTARDTRKVAGLAEADADRVLALALDVTDPGQVTSTVAQAEQKVGAIDILVNNAGYGYRAAVEEGDEPDVRTLFETHFFGAIAMIKAVLPGMRARRSGAIVNISTIGVQIMPMGSGYYAASKAALEGMSGALHAEVKPLGISVTVVEPGAFRTDFAGRSLTQSNTVIDDYADTAGKRRKEHDTAHGTQPGDPAKAAQAIITAVESSEPPAFLLLGTDALTTYRRLAAARLDAIQQWEHLTTSTDINARTRL
jgi:NAD(P)-dependent dehydrogenase (short-subunit alcohol dehydrogenase family)